MAVNFEELITKHAGEDGNIPAASIAKIASAISSAVGREFVAKERYNAKLDEIETLKGEKQTAEDNATNAAKWEKKYNELKGQFDDFKADTEAKAKESAKREAIREVAKSAGLSAEGIEKAVKYTDIGNVELDENGKVKDADNLTKALQTEWSGYKVTTNTQGAKVETPPANPNPSGANSRAAELAKAYHERLYGTPANGNKNE